MGIKGEPKRRDKKNLLIERHFKFGYLEKADKSATRFADHCR
jgi:hypothetical protein